MDTAAWYEFIELTRKKTREMKNRSPSSDTTKEWYLMKMQGLNSATLPKKVAST